MTRPEKTPMTTLAKTLTWLMLLSLLSSPTLLAQNEGEEKDEELPTLAEKTRGLEKRSGLLDLFVDDEKGKIFLALPPPSGERGQVAEVLWVEGLVTGLGSNPVGLDRGQFPEDSRVLDIRRLGPRVLFEVPNLKFRARTDNPEELQAARESFAPSVLWGTDVVALDADGGSLIDLTPFLLRDAHRVSESLRQGEHGEYALDPARSAVDFSSCLAFPDNLEFESLLTYAAQGPPGEEVSRTAPLPDAFTLVQHQSFIRLPDDGYELRRGDPRIGMFGIDYLDYAVPLDEPLRQRFIARHRLEKVDPSAERSEAVEPIVFYVDRGAPEPVRSALVDGASWWAEAFEAAGFIDGFRVELLPPDVHPLDVRYNVIQWVHRSTRGWSYGGGVIDPRTGEFIKGHVNLGSLRVRQDRLLFEGLAGTVYTGSGRDDDPVEIALARIRQLAAHEVGHALGITHNFAASTYDGRASVMDYPAPLIGVTPEGELDFSNAYGVGVGTWDVLTVRYAYGQFPPGSGVDAELEALVREGLDRGLLFLADADARPPFASDPRANLWDNGSDAVEALELSLRVRRLALDRFGVDNVAPGRPLAELEEVLAPVYFHHRYQLEAAAKTLGGMEYHYALRGDGQVPTRIVGAERQRRALEVILGILEPENLDVPEGVLELLAPRPYEVPRHRELFASNTLPAFDALGAASTAADAVVTALIEPHRLARLHDFHRRDPTLPGPEEVLLGLLEKTFGQSFENPRHAEIDHAVEWVVAERLVTLAAHPEASPAVRSWAEGGLRRAAGLLEKTAGSEDLSAVAHARTLHARISRFLKRADAAPTMAVPPPPMPPGSPIGVSPEYLGGCSWLPDHPATRMEEAR